MNRQDDSNKNEHPSYEALLDEAAYWIVKLRSPDLSEADKKAFSKWLNQSHQHIRAFDDMSDTWSTMGRVKEVESLQKSVAHIRAPKRFSLKSIFFNSTFPLVFACTLLACVVFLWPSLQNSSLAPSVTYATEIGKQRKISLDDGSVITLNTASEVVVTFTENTRRITLLSGEALFEVAKDQARPFVVDIGVGTVTAVGTAFNIRTDNRPQITVVEGIVDVHERKDKHTPYPKWERLHAGDQVAFLRNGITEVTKSNINSELAWRIGQLIVSNEPLSQVLSELNRYLYTAIQFDETSLNSVYVSGTFDIYNPEAMLTALTERFNLEIVNTQSGTRVVRTKS